MEFTEQKQQIVSLLKRGDKKAIATRAGLSRVTVWNAMCKCCMNEMTESERHAWNVAVDFMNDRQKKNETIERKTSKLAEKL